MSQLRYLTSGESHGEKLTGILEGMPSGLDLVAERDIDPYLQERQKGYGRGRRQQIEQDIAIVSSGVRFGKTLGSPIALTIQNRDWANWQERMAIQPTDAEKLRAVTIPRPGHSDFAGGVKYEQERELRNVFERSSARETAMRTAIGAIALRMLDELGILHVGFVSAIGLESIPKQTSLSITELVTQTLSSQVRAPNEEASLRMMVAIDDARNSGDTLGGIVECRFENLPIGVGSQSHWDRKLDGLIAQAVLSTQAVKAVEFGEGILMSRSRGSQVHDSFGVQDGVVTRASNNAGGIEGGMSNGEPLIVRAFMKPISTLLQPLRSVDLATGETADAHIERSDTCAVPALSVILQAVIGLTIASAILETFGGDTMNELKSRVELRRARTGITAKHS